VQGGRFPATCLAPGREVGSIRGLTPNGTKLRGESCTCPDHRITARTHVLPCRIRAAAVVVLRGWPLRLPGSCSSRWGSAILHRGMPKSLQAALTIPWLWNSTRAQRLLRSSLQTRLLKTLGMPGSTRQRAEDWPGMPRVDDGRWRVYGLVSLEYPKGHPKASNFMEDWAPEAGAQVVAGFELEDEWTELDRGVCDDRGRYTLSLEGARKLSSTERMLGRIRVRATSRDGVHSAGETSREASSSRPLK
jgi:hypothetical protein